MSERRWLVGAFAIVVVVFGTTSARSSGYKVVVHPENPAHVLRKNQVSDIFLKRATTFPDGTHARPVDQPAENTVRNDFSRQIHGRSAEAVKNFWNQQVYAGRNFPPTVVRSDAEVLQYVRSNRGAIGYVDGDAPTEGVRVVEVQMR